MCLLAAALLSAILLAGCGDDSRSPQPDAREARVQLPADLRVGLVANSLDHSEDPGETQDDALETGVRRLREEVRWSMVEPQPGARDWRVTDQLFTDAALRGIRLLPLLTDAPDWSVPSDGGLPAAPDAYGAFVRDAVDRYGRDGTFWRARPELDRDLAPRWFELWNEPYFVKQDDGERDDALNAERYAALAGAAISATRRDGRDVRFLVPVATSSSTRTDDDVEWLDALEAARPGLLANADAFAAHPYGIVEPEGFAPLDELLEALRDRGVRKPVWITEIGWSTCDGGDDECVSEEVQADSLAALFDGIARDYAGIVEAVFVYHLHDWRVQPEGGREGAYGLLRIGGSEKPAFSVLRRYARAETG